MEKKYNVQWETFPNHLLGVFRGLGEQGDFADVTLVSDDQIQTPAHKVVLSACSPVLRTLLINNPHSHPLIYLRGIKQPTLTAILDFMYFGETQISGHCVNTFFDVARDLEVKEISKEVDKKDKTLTKEEKYFEETVYVSEQLPGETKGEVKIENPLISGSETKSYMKSKKVKKRSEERKVGEMFSCQKCERRFSNFSNLIRHKRIKHENVRYKCDQCEYQATRREHLKTHSEGKHGGVKYWCDQCEYQAGWLNGIRQHKKNRH